MLHKVYLSIIALLIIAVAVVGGLLYLNRTVQAVKDNTVQEASAEANTRAAEVHAKETVKVYRNKEKALEEVRAVEERHPEWADEPVPDDVAAILRKPAGPARVSD